MVEITTQNDFKNATTNANENDHGDPIAPSVDANKTAPPPSTNTPANTKKPTEAFTDAVLTGQLFQGFDQQSMGNAFSNFFRIISLLLQGRMEEFNLAVDVHYGSGGDYEDPAFQAQAKNFIKTITDPNNTQSMAEIVKDNEDLLTSPGMNQILDKLSPAAKNFMKMISSVESQENDWNVVNDYRNRINTLKSSEGFQPEEKTPGGLTVPEFTSMKVRDVIAWQKSYIQEQKSYEKIHGTDSEKDPAALSSRSSAVGRYQFLYGTLEGLVKNGYIAADDTFNPQTQTIAALYNAHDSIIKNSENLTLDQLADKAIGQWEGLKNIPRDDLKNVLKDLRDEGPNAPKQNISALQTSPSTPQT